MSVDSQLLATAIGLGMTYNAAPGAVNTEALRRGLSRGARSALLVQLGALIGDSLWAALALTGTSFLVRSHTLHVVLGLAGACFLLRLAWSVLADARSGRVTEPLAAGSRGDFATGAFFSLANPFALAFWSGIGGALTVSDTAGSHGAGFALLFAGFVLGALLWCLAMPVALGWGRRLVRPAVIRGINALCGIALGYFGFMLLWNTLHSFVDHAAGAFERDARLLARGCLERVWVLHEPSRTAS
jgi:threonine/homoserine/homoserine lactone efflux protein